MSKGHKIINIFAKNESLRDVVVFAICLIAGLIFGSAINVASSAGAESYIDTTSASIASESIKNYDQKSTIEKVELAAIQTKNEYTEPKVSTGAGILYMPNIGINMTASRYNSNCDSYVPNSGFAVTCGNVLVGHNPGSFSGLVSIYNRVASGESITFNYNGREYTTYGAELAELSQDRKSLGVTRNGNRAWLNMNKISADKSSIILMTCYGSMRSDGNTTHRILIYAK